MKPFFLYFYMVLFVFQNFKMKFGNFCWILPLATFGSERVKATIALPFQSSLTTSVVQWRKKSAKKCAARSEFLLCLLNLFLFLLFSFPLSGFGCAELVSNVTTQNNSWYATISPEKLKNPTFWWKTVDEIDRCFSFFRLLLFFFLSCSLFLTTDLLYF